MSEDDAVRALVRRSYAPGEELHGRLTAMFGTRYETEVILGGDGGCVLLIRVWDEPARGLTTNVRSLVWALEADATWEQAQYGWTKIVENIEATEPKEKT